MSSGCPGLVVPDGPVAVGSRLFDTCPSVAAFASRTWLERGSGFTAALSARFSGF
jgi:hypothetical protein